MSDPVIFYRSVVTTVSAFINDLDNLRVMSDRIANDPQLVIEAATAAVNGGRADLSIDDFNNLKSAIDQILFTFNSGSPPQKQAFYEFL
jgi:hypothetical protein